MGAIVEELGSGTGADHIVIVRRRPDARVLEATLVNARTGGSTSSTTFPIADLEDAPEPPRQRRSRRPPPRIGQDEPAGDPELAAGLPRVRPRGPLSPGASERSAHAVERACSAPGRPAGVASQARPAADADPDEAAGPSGGFGGRFRDADPDQLVAERIASRARTVFGLRHTLVAPLTIDRGIFGALLVSRRTAGDWPPVARRLLAGAASEASAALSRAYSHRQAEARASTDGLTGLPESALLRRVLRAACPAPPGGGRRRGAHGRYRQVQGPERHVRPPGRRRGPPRGCRRRSSAPSARRTSRPATAARSSRSSSATPPARSRSRSASASARRSRELDLGRFEVAGVSVSVGAAVAD